jgi:hypothetical protein
MRGSIRKRGSTYIYWLDVGPDPVTGRHRQRTKGGFRTKRECQAALNEAIAAVQGGTFVEPSRRTVRGFLLEEWLPAVQVANLRPGTWENYRIHVQAHVVPALGTVELQRLSPAQLNAFYRHLLTEAGRDGHGLASKTVRNIHRAGSGHGGRPAAASGAAARTQAAGGRQLPGFGVGVHLAGWPTDPPAAVLAVVRAARPPGWSAEDSPA